MTRVQKIVAYYKEVTGDSILFSDVLRLMFGRIGIEEDQEKNTLTPVLNKMWRDAQCATSE